VGDGVDGGAEVVLCMARFKGAASFRERCEGALRHINIGKHLDSVMLFTLMAVDVEVPVSCSLWGQHRRRRVDGGTTRS
jgi:hypothetical protein